MAVEASFATTFLELAFFATALLAAAFLGPEDVFGVFSTGLVLVFSAAFFVVVFEAAFLAGAFALGASFLAAGLRVTFFAAVLAVVFFTGVFFFAEGLADFFTLPPPFFGDVVLLGLLPLTAADLPLVAAERAPPRDPSAGVAARVR